LFYDPAQAPFAGQLPQLCALQGIRLRRVEKEELGRTVSALAQGLRGEAAPVLRPIPEPMMVFCHLSDGQINRLLQALQRSGAVCLKAVLTPTNAQWTFAALYAELAKERFQLGRPGI
jgi:hypothetical protein